MSEPSPFNSQAQESLAFNSSEDAIKIEQQKLLNEQKENERAFEELDEQRLRELEKAENEEIIQKTKKEYVVKDRTLQEFLGGFSETILGILNDVLYKIANPDELSWSDIITTGNRPMYIGLLIVVISVFIAFTK